MISHMSWPLSRTKGRRLSTPFHISDLQATEHSRNGGVRVFRALCSIFLIKKRSLGSGVGEDLFGVFEEFQGSRF